MALLVKGRMGLSSISCQVFWEIPPTNSSSFRAGELARTRSRAGVDLRGHHRPGLADHGFFRHLLQFLIDGQIDVVAGQGFLGGDLLLLEAVGIHLQQGMPQFAAQFGLQHFLQPLFADRVTALVIAPALCFCSSSLLISPR